MGRYATVDSALRWLTAYLVRVGRIFHPLPVWYRTSDLEIDAVRELKGADRVWKYDRNQLLGFRAIRRAMLCPNTFRRELGAFAKAAKVSKNLGLIFPYLTDPKELEWAIKQSRASDISSPISMMAEIPASILCLDEFLSLAVDRVIIGTSDLLRLTTGAWDIPARYPYQNRGLVRLIEMARRVTAEKSIPLAISFDLPSLDLVTFSDDLGLDECIIAYEALRRCFGDEFRDLPEASLVSEIKAARNGQRRARDP